VQRLGVLRAEEGVLPGVAGVVELTRERRAHALVVRARAREARAGPGRGARGGAREERARGARRAEEHREEGGRGAGATRVEEGRDGNCPRAACESVVPPEDALEKKTKIEDGRG
jgi:hypothetical protein